MIEFGSAFASFLVSIGVSLSHTTLFVRFGPVLNAIIGLFGKICFRCDSVVQVSRVYDSLTLCMLSQN